MRSLLSGHYSELLGQKGSMLDKQPGVASSDTEEPRAEEAPEDIIQR